LDVLMTIAAIALGIAIALQLAHYLVDAAKQAFGDAPAQKQEQERASLEIPMDAFWEGINRFMNWAAPAPQADEKAKRKNDDDLEPDEKPKRKNSEFIMGDDGELIEVFHDEGMSLDDLINRYDREQDE
jgi:hypothetical protein